jgi:hypothetical protein
MRRFRHGHRQNSASRMMIGSGTPRSQSSAPRPNPMASSFVFGLDWRNNAATEEMVPLEALFRLERSRKNVRNGVVMAAWLDAETRLAARKIQL